MKSICSILILMILAHAQCGLQCLISDSHRPAPEVESAPEQPPCHQHKQTSNEVPSNHDSSQQSQEKSSSCGQAQTSESKIAPISKSSIQWIVLDVDASQFSVQQVTFGVIGVVQPSTLFDALPTGQHVVLRI